MFDCRDHTCTTFYWISRNKTQAVVVIVPGILLWFNCNLIRKSIRPWSPIARWRKNCPCSSHSPAHTHTHTGWLIKFYLSTTMMLRALFFFSLINNLFSIVKWFWQYTTTHWQSCSLTPAYFVHEIILFRNFILSWGRTHGGRTFSFDFSTTMFIRFCWEEIKMSACLLPLRRICFFAAFKSQRTLWFGVVWWWGEERTISCRAGAGCWTKWIFFFVELWKLLFSWNKIWAAYFFILFYFKNTIYDLYAIQLLHLILWQFLSE